MSARTRDGRATETAVMVAFDQVFGEGANQESRVINTLERTGKRGTYVFREYYCATPGCDCRRVLVEVLWAEGKCVAAYINYGFEPPKQRGYSQIWLDSVNPQSERAGDLLKVFTSMIEQDREYREQLIRHYKMWRRVVDDPRHPDHAKLRRQEQDAPASGQQPRRKKNQKAGAQGKRAGEPTAAEAARSLERVAAKGGPAGGKGQQRFRSLLEKVDRLKRRVRAWKDARADIDTEISKHAAVVEQQCRLGRDMVSLLDRAYGSSMFSKADRRKMAALIVEIAGDLIGSGGYDDLKPIYNRYGRSDFDEEAKAKQAAGAEALREMMEEMGLEFGDADVSSIEKLHAFTEEKLREMEEEEAARRAGRKRSAKQQAAEARREDERRRASKALQDVYRALAKALHPDHEQDPAERERKAELMREVNVAYEAKDLLRLLELQLELERVEPERADAIAEEKLLHYNRILDEQARQLASELEELEMPFRIQLDLPPTARLAPVNVLGQIRADTAAVKRQIAMLERDLEAFADACRLKALLKARPHPGPRGQEREDERDRGRAPDLFG